MDVKGCLPLLGTNYYFLCVASIHGCKGDACHGREGLRRCYVWLVADVWDAYVVFASETPRSMLLRLLLYGVN